MTNIKSNRLIFFIIVAIAFLLPLEGYGFGINQKTMQDGLTILHLNRQNIPAVALTLLINASPLHEPAGKDGLAHLTAKMLLEGTASRTSRQLHEELDFIGASLNVNVTHDYTSITLTVLKKDLQKAFEILSDVLINPSFDEKEIERRKAIIIGSLRQREEEPSYLAKREFNKILFSDHPYGRVIEGSKESLENITRKDIISFYNDRFRPNLSILSVAGDVTLEEIEQFVKRQLKDWPVTDRDKSLENNKLEIVKRQISQKISIIHRDITQANIIFGHLGIERSNPDFYALSVMNYILGGGGFASRLMKSVRDDLGLTYGISSYFSLNKHIGSFEIEVQTKNESAMQVVKEIIRQIEKIQVEDVSQQDLTDAKSFLIGSFPRRLETNRKIADFLALIYFFNLGKDYIEKYPEYIQNVTAEDIKRVAKKYLNSKDYVLVITGNEELISTKDIQAR